jgi:hypothetical protein
MKTKILLLPLFILLSCQSEVQTSNVEPLSMDPNLEDACAQVFDPVCGIPPKRICSDGLDCKQVSDPTKTYSNACVLKNAGAKLLHEGECGTKHIGEVCQTVYAPVCGQPKSEPCPEGQACTLALPLPRTYGNECEMLVEGASLIHPGECETKEYIDEKN